MTDARGKYRFLVGLSSGLIYWRELEGRNDSLDGWLIVVVERTDVDLVEALTG